MTRAAKAAHAVEKALPTNPFLASVAARSGRDPVEIWPDNWASWQFYCLVSTQWIVGGMGGRVALNYPACFAVMDEMGVPAEERRQLLRDLREIEGAVLEQQAEDHKTE